MVDLAVISWPESQRLLTSTCCLADSAATPTTGALDASRLKGEASNHAGRVFRAPGDSWERSVAADAWPALARRRSWQARVCGGQEALRHLASVLGRYHYR
jgi:hypothetical protein